LYTINDIAKMAGVSITTVSRAFNNHPGISAETRDKILSLSSNLHYSPKRYKQHSKPIKRSATVGIVNSFQSYPWCNFMMEGICDTLEKENLFPVFANTNEIPYREIICIDRMKDSVIGMIVVSSTEFNDYCTNFLTEINKTIPIVTMVRNTHLDNIDSVEIDSYHSSYEAINCLIKNGHRHIAIINGPMVIKPSINRFNAYTQALKDNNIQIHNEYVYYADFNENNAYNIANRILERNPLVTAIFGCNSIIARGCVRAFANKKINVPEDIAFIAYGDDFAFSLPSNNVSAILDPDYEVGANGASLLINRIQKLSGTKKRKPQRIILTPQLMLRGSEAFPVNRSGN
jgi:LacI family transcriptional regulator